MSVVVTKPRQTAVDGLAPADWSDEQLLLSYRETGQQQLFGELVRRYERELYSYLRRYLGHAELAEDAFQATFLQLHLKCEQFDGGRRLRPWLYMIATNKAIDLQRRARRHRLISLQGAQFGGNAEEGGLADLLAGKELSPEERLDGAEHGDWVTDQINGLPEHLRAVIHLVYFQGLKYREAAEALSIPVGTVKSRLHTAISKLTDAWNDSAAERE
jgi:RNA polymerase sigma-70 factor (ECF subfamily)